MSGENEHTHATSFYMLEVGDQRHSVKTLLDAIRGKNSHLYTDEIVEATHQATKCATAEELRIVEFRIVRLATPIARRAPAELKFTTLPPTTRV